MVGPTPEFHRLASRLLEYETEGRQEPVELADAGERICRKLYGQWAPLLGPEGFRVIMARALHLTNAEFPFLEPVEVEISSDACLKGLRERAQGLEPIELGRGIVALFASFIWLLASLISEELTFRNLARIWPDVSLRKEGEGPREVKNE